MFLDLCPGEIRLRRTIAEWERYRHADRVVRRRAPEEIWYRLIEPAEKVSRGSRGRQRGIAYSAESESLASSIERVEKEHILCSCQKVRCCRSRYQAS